MQGITTEAGTMMTLEVLGHIQVGSQKVEGAELATALKEELSKSHVAFPYQTVFHLVKTMTIAWLGEKGSGKGHGREAGAGARGRDGRGPGGLGSAGGVGGASSPWLGGST